MSYSHKNTDFQNRKFGAPTLGEEDFSQAIDQAFIEDNSEVPTQPFNRAIHSVLQDERMLSQDEPTLNVSHLELLRDALRERDIDQLKQTVQMINLLFLDEQIDPDDLEFDMQQISQWFFSNDSDDIVRMSLSDESYILITMIGSKEKDCEFTFFFSNPSIQKQFGVLSLR